MLNRRKVCLHGKWSEINSPMSCFSSSIVTLCVFSFCLQAQLILAFHTLLFIAMPVWHNVSGLMGLGLSLLAAVASDPYSCIRCTIPICSSRNREVLRRTMSVQ